MTPSLQLADPLIAGSTHAVRRSVDFFLRTQAQEGYWWADLTADTTLESDYILLLLWLHPPKDGVWNPPCSDRVQRAVQSILKRQLPDGGFNIYPNGPADVSATVKAYFALKLAGIPIDDPRLMTARQTILRLGGIQAANSYVKLNLSFFGLYPRDCVPSIPPEMILLPGDFIYQMSSWTRAIVIPLAIVDSMNPMRPVPKGFDLKELILPNVPLGFRRDKKLFTWRNLFLTLDRGVKWWQRKGSRSIRTRALRRAEQWMLERTRYSDGLGAIYPPMMYAIMALDLLGYPPDHPDRVEAQQQFENLIVQDEQRFFFQPCFSVVWDAAIAAFAVGQAREVMPAHMQLVSSCETALERCGNWLVTKEVRRRGDWSVKRPDLEPSGWYFEFANEFYPDIDDTAMVLLGLSQAPGHTSGRQGAAVKRSLHWLLRMQSKDGGWAAFDVDNNWKALADVPFADHNAMLDPTCPDITGRVLEALMSYGIAPSHPAAQRAIQYLQRTQEQDGSWYGRWGVDYIYGTFLALRGLRAAAESDREAYILRAGEWLRSIQNADGGWGESCASYDNNTFTSAPSTASQTAWALLGLMAGGDTNSISVQRGVEYLISTQQSDGTWNETLATGTGFPRVFYLSYHMYRNAFPLLALAEFLKLRSADGGYQA